MLLICYPKCSTCQKAKKWLDGKDIAYTERNIAEENPTYEELKEWYEKSGLPLKKFFNTSGMLYKQMQLKDKLPTITMWLMGSLAGAKWENLAVIIPCVFIATLFFCTQSRILNMMLLGDEVSITLGTDLHRYRQVYLVVTALLIGFVVYSAGIIGFVGLIIPHVVRMFFGTDHKKMLPLSALSGSIFLIWADVASRIIIPKSEVPIGILVSMIGAPCFIYLLVRRSYGFGGEKS